MFTTQASKFFSFILSRVKRTRFTAAYFVFTLVFCLAQCLTLSLMYTYNSEQYTNLRSLTQIGVSSRIFPVKFDDKTTDENGFRLEICESSVFEVNPSCRPIFNTGERIMWNASSSPNFFKGSFGPGMSIPARKESSSPDAPVNISGQCLLIMLYPLQLLQNKQREDVVQLTVQLWVLCISVFGLAYESIPHIIAVFLVRLLTAVWSAYAIVRTQNHIRIMTSIIHSSESPCDPRIGIYPSYFRARKAIETPDLALNMVALLISAYLTVTLIKAYDKWGFNRVGAPKEIRRIYRLFMGSLAAFQLAVIFLLETLSLWLSQMCQSPIGEIAYHRPVYLALCICTFVIVFPWFFLGWYAIRQERKQLMIAFLCIALLLVVSWSLMLVSWSYRWTFIEWPFFAIIVSLGGACMTTSIIFATFCWWNFDKGLAHYFYVDTVLARLNFFPDIFDHDVEKSTPRHSDDFGPDLLQPLGVLNIGTRIERDPEILKQDLDNINIQARVKSETT